MGCIRNIIISSTTTTGTGVILVPNTPITPSNLNRFRLIIACNVNTPTANEVVYVQTTAGNVPLLCRYGNNLLANQLNKRVPYLVLFGNQNASYANGQFVLASCACLNQRGTEATTTVTNTEETQG